MWYLRVALEKILHKCSSSLLYSHFTSVPSVVLNCFCLVQLFAAFYTPPGVTVQPASSADFHWVAVHIERYGQAHKKSLPACCIMPSLLKIRTKEVLPLSADLNHIMCCALARCPDNPCQHLLGMYNVNLQLLSEPVLYLMQLLVYSSWFVKINYAKKSHFSHLAALELFSHCQVSLVL